MSSVNELAVKIYGGKFDSNSASQYLNIVISIGEGVMREKRQMRYLQTFADSYEIFAS